MKLFMLEKCCDKKMWVITLFGVWMRRNIFCIINASTFVYFFPVYIITATLFFTDPQLSRQILLHVTCYELPEGNFGTILLEKFVWRNWCFKDTIPTADVKCFTKHHCFKCASKFFNIYKIINSYSLSVLFTQKNNGDIMTSSSNILHCLPT